MARLEVEYDERRCRRRRRRRLKGYNDVGGHAAAGKDLLEEPIKRLAKQKPDGGRRRRQNAQ